MNKQPLNHSHEENNQILVPHLTQRDRCLRIWCEQMKWLSIYVLITGLSACSSRAQTPSSSSLPTSITGQQIQTRLVGPSGVKRWEPSGVESAPQSLWVVSDRGGWLARYALPLKKGSNRPAEAHQLQPNLKHRVKWEGLAWERDEQNQPSALLLLEAISRSVWRCSRPHDGCPELIKLPLKKLNPLLNKAVPTPFKYIMFEAVTYHHGVKVGVRGYQDKKRGLIPWSLLVSDQAQVLMDGRTSLILEKKRYGLSGATYDQKRHGYWLTWSYEDEDGSTLEAVEGVLSFTSLSSKAPLSKPESEQARLNWGAAILPSPQSGVLKVCARFNLKPEGVTLNQAGDLFIVFDEDLDRKMGDINHQETTQKLPKRFALRDFEDWIWRAPSDQILQTCETYSSPKSP